VLDLLLSLSERCRLVPLLGNPEEMLLFTRRARTSSSTRVTTHTEQRRGEILDLGFLKCRPAGKVEGVGGD
jgi:hypothetical protein